MQIPHLINFRCENRWLSYEISNRSKVLYVSIVLGFFINFVILLHLQSHIYYILLEMPSRSIFSVLFNFLRRIFIKLSTSGAHILLWNQAYDVIFRTCLKTDVCVCVRWRFFSSYMHYQCAWTSDKRLIYIYIWRKFVSSEKFNRDVTRCSYNIPYAHNINFIYCIQRTKVFFRSSPPKGDMCKNMERIKMSHCTFLAKCCCSSLRI